MDFDLVIKDGTLVFENGTAVIDIGISSGKIQAIDIDLKGRETIHARDMLVIPGGVDPHVHLEMQSGAAVSSDDWSSGTQAAAIGGTTTVIDFVDPEPSQTLMQALEERKKTADLGTWIDYSLHMTLSDPNPDILAEIPEVIKAGIPSFKIYTTYDSKLEDEEILAAMNVVGLNGGLILTHAENDAIVQFMRSKLISAGKISPGYHPVSRPAAAEAEAVERVLAMAVVTQTPVYIVHISTQLGAQSIQRALERGQTVYGETCPQYLLLTDAEYERPGFEPAKFICSPPLRKKEDNNFLWQALGEGILQSIGTDHCPFFYAGQKELGREKFTMVPGGMPGIESRIMLLYAYGVLSGKISLNQWAALTSTNAAKIFGLYPHKGAILPGSDADLVIFDPSQKGVISVDMLHENVDYTPYEGMPYHGYPVITILGGKIIARDGRLISSRRTGKFLERPTPKI